MVIKRKVIRLLYRLAYQAQQLYYIIWRPITMGVNVLIVEDDAILLIRQSYKEGWSLPGGGMKRGETLTEAARREVMEEVGFTLHRLEFLGMYSNLASAKSDHVAFFLSDRFTPPDKPHYSHEIEEYRFFDIDALPPTINYGTQRRLAYLMGHTAVSAAEIEDFSQDGAWAIPKQSTLHQTTKEW
jgi:8-oxo-dGTP pyrophosphatase MutT (NUDIX family)